jgi:PTH2 family peptidyl-tRNA hydrolase
LVAELKEARPFRAERSHLNGTTARREPQASDFFQGWNASADTAGRGSGPGADTIPEDSLFTYAIVRGDLEMCPGKLSAQASHACRISLLKFIERHPERLREFIGLNSCGSVVTLKGRNLADLERAWREATAAGLPCALFTDSGHILPPHFYPNSLYVSSYVSLAVRGAGSHGRH